MTQPTTDAREALFRRVAGSFIDEDYANELLDAYRAAVLREAADAIAALDPVEAALAGSHAWNDAAALLRRRAEEARS